MLERKLNLNDKKNKQKAFMHYVVFQTHMTDLAQVASGRALTPEKALKRMLEAKDFFQKTSDSYQLRFSWPHKTGGRPVTINATPTKLEFYYHDNVFLTMKLASDNKMTVEAYDKAEWRDKDIHEIVSNFSEALQISPSLMPPALKTKLYHFDKETFTNKMASCADYNVTYRIQNLFLDNGRQRLNDFTLRLDWPFQGVTHKLKLIFSRAERFSRDFNGGEPYSWLMPEESLLAYFPHYGDAHVKPGQYYYDLRAYEITKTEAGKEEREVLAAWLSQDAFVGELRTVNSGVRFPGNAVLDLFYAIDEGVFKIQNTFVCDASHLMMDEVTKMPMRLIFALATPEGETWYQRKLPGLSLFDCNQFRTLADRVVTQNSFQREKAVTELRALALTSWSNMLSEEKQHLLKGLCAKHLPESGDKATLKDLAIKIFDDSKAQKNTSPDLMTLVRLLCEGTRVFKKTKPFAAGDSDYKVKVLVEQLLEGRFWIKTRKVDTVPEEELRPRMG